jgi:hypothetical protein
VKHPLSTSQQPPPPADQDYASDLQFDDDYWLERRLSGPKLLGFLPIERLERRLQAEASADFQRRAEAEPEERRERRLEGERRLRELVLQANETDDPGLWEQVDFLAFGQAATEAAPEAL